MEIPFENIPDGDRRYRHALDIIGVLHNAGFTAYIVGGAVRDMVMGQVPGDYDIATDAEPDDVAGLFDKVYRVGAAFGVSCVVRDGVPYEVARFREDMPYSDGRRPEGIVRSGAGEDVRRRDFTVNALLFDPLRRVILDYVGGMRDIRDRLLRTVGDPAVRFGEDHLRMVRAVRFAASLDFTLDPATAEAIAANAPRISRISRERVGIEIAKAFSCRHADRALVLLDETGLLEHIMPEVAAMHGVRQPENFHPEGDVFEHTRRMLALFEGGSVTLGFGILLHDVGKPVTMTVEDRIRFNRHDSVGGEIAGKVLRRLRMRTAVVRQVHMLVKNHMRFIHIHDMRKSTLRKFVSMEGFDELLELHRLDCLASHGSLDSYHFALQALEDEKNREGEIELPPPLLNGNDLLSRGYEEGPEIGEILEEVRNLQLDGDIGTTEEAIRYVERAYPRRRG